MKKIIAISCCIASFVFSQSKDSTMIFESPEQEMTKPIPSAMDDAWGADILLSNNGFGIAGFYRHQYSRDLFGTITFGIAESKDENEVEYYDWYGQSFVPGKINRFLLIPLHVGVQYRLFAEDITDSFRPYLNAGMGPTLVLASPYNREYFNSLGYARSNYTLGGYFGIGAFFGFDPGSLSGINIRYYFVPFSNGIESLRNGSGVIERKKDFGGFFITINLGSVF
jgi:hypothetical protein